jgi:hypothetical protein
MPAPYFVYVLGQGRPRRGHTTLETARTEAKRLHDKLFQSQQVFVLESIEKLEPESSQIAEQAPSPLVVIKRRRVINRGQS